MLFGVIQMSFMAIGAKLVKLNTNHGVMKVAFFRSFIMATGAYSHGKFIYKIDPWDIEKDMRWLMLWRSVFGTMAFYFELIAIYLMPISLAIVLYFTQPVFASLFGFLFNGEKLNKFDLAGVIFSLIGVVIVSKPGLILSHFGLETDVSEEDKEAYPYFAMGVCSAISGAMSSAGAYVFMRRIGTRVHTCLKPMYFGIFSSILCIIIQGLIEMKNPPSNQHQKS